jgi:rhamnosyltransferase subunit B
MRTQSPLLGNLEFMGPWLDRSLTKIARYSTNRWVGAITRLRRDLGLPRGGNPIFEGQFSPQLTLALFSPLFGKPQPDWPPNTVVTGFPFYDEPATMDDKLRNFLTDGDPPVVFTLGSSASAAPRKFFEESLRAVARLGCRAALVVGDFAPNPFNDGLPPGVAAFAYAPYAQLFAHGAVNVHHGGIGTTAEVLRAGRPMLVVPFSFDQPDNAARAKKLGVARSLMITQYNAARASRELEALLRDPAYAKKAAEGGRQIQMENGVSKACDELEKLLAS